MTAVHEVELSCDAHGPMSCVDSSPVHARTALQARRAARAAGWLTGQPGGRDYCPVHARTASYARDLAEAAWAYRPEETSHHADT